ncbi:unnamed protein product [Rotaria sp. Silwood2]|nr:unnamed protein product [Rotaria sp. Silwood2]CAF2498400.1 unnamed protein product [Rotaria sp. Silwood2]
MHKIFLYDFIIIGKSIVEQFRSSLSNTNNDIHAKLMSHYPEIADWCWLLWKAFPNIKWLALINFPILLMATINMPPAPAGEFPSWFLVGFIFNFILYRYAHNWWEKYAYIFSIAMSCGVAICGFIIFFALQLNHTSFPQWWGLGGLNGDGCPLDSANFSGVIPTDRYI